MPKSMELSQTAARGKNIPANTDEQELIPTVFSGELLDLLFANRAARMAA
jgi:hypothetical protein